MRIRTIKPEFFKHDGIAALPPLTRILFIGLWSLADKGGRLEDRAKRIKIEVLPYDDVEIEGMLCELCAGGFIDRYETADRSLRIIQIHGFSKHQRITGKEAETESELPEFNPDTCMHWMGRVFADAKTSTDKRGSNGETLGKQRGNTGETPETTGREGKGKEGNEEGKGMELGESAAPSAPAAIEKPAKVEQTDEQWLADLAADPAYAHVSIPAEWSKMHRWCATNRKQPTRRRFVNWINRIDRPVAAPGTRSAAESARVATILGYQEGL